LRFSTKCFCSTTIGGATRLQPQVTILEGTDMAPQKALQYELRIELGLSDSLNKFWNAHGRGTAPCPCAHGIHGQGFGWKRGPSQRPPQMHRMPVQDMCSTAPSAGSSTTSDIVTISRHENRSWRRRWANRCLLGRYRFHGSRCVLWPYPFPVDMTIII
jgi:hypothetical protein